MQAIAGPDASAAYDVVVRTSSSLLADTANPQTTLAGLVTSLNTALGTNVVASSGTSLTQDQVRLIKRYSTAVTILYDGDPAGIKASLRGIDLILAEGLSVKVVLFPDGDDPDSFTLF